MEGWIAETVGKMHVHKITQTELAKEVGWRRDYLSRVLSKAVPPKGAEEKITAALDRLIAKKTAA